MPSTERNSIIIAIYCTFIIAVIFVLIALFGWNNLGVILYDPLTTPETWCEIQPWIEFEFFSRTITFIQPSSTVFVYLLGIIAIVFGFNIFRNKIKQKSHQWWGIALVFWGAGAIFAGTSYQAFGYELKCYGREYCLWTSWLEVIYLLLSVGSVNAMMIAQSYSCASGKKLKIKIMQFYAFINMLIYMIIIGIGSIIPVRFLISFELMLLFLAPSIIFFFYLNVKRYLKQKKRMDLVLIGVWISLGIVMVFYYLYLMLGFTEVLWEHGFWFSENDVLHIGLILWMIYIRVMILKYVIDT
ncbi:MAG: hypothetical protein GY870_05975 [archaeon]|nr:hypothetical protein [archaeon]